jgi:deazaflavin-dependent oxidoreductase (nitroreductase family)
MGLAAALSYRHRPPRAVHRAFQRFGSTRAGAWSFAKILPPLDRLAHRLSKGRTSMPALLAGLPVLMVSTTGRNSGKTRASPLIAVPLGEDLALIGTNFGQARTPAWVYNLEAQPRGTAEYRGRRCPFVARPATDDERAAVWRAGSGIYGGYDKYQERIRGRVIRIFVLEDHR